MKYSKLFSAVVIASAMVATVADAGSIGRSGGGGGGRSSSSSSSGSSSHSSTMSAPSKPSAAPSPTAPAAKPGGIGGNTAGSAIGVRKSEVTAPVAQQVRPATVNPEPGKPGSFPVPTNSPQYAPAPAPVVVGGGGGFGSSFAGALGGTLVGNMLFGNHGNGGTTVVNNGGGYSGASPVQSTGVPTVVDSSGQVIQQPGTVVVQQKESMGMGTIILNVILFAILIAVIVGIIILFYKGFKMLKEYVNKERGVSNQPFNPTQQFWTIQKAFSKADETALRGLLGPDIVDELVNSLQPSELTLFNVSHEVRLSNNTEFSVWYKFKDNDEDVNQVWHYEKFGKDWLLNGIETV